MSRLTEKKRIPPRGRQTVFSGAGGPISLIALLLALSIGLVGMLYAAKRDQQDMEAVLEMQRKTIAELQSQPKEEPDGLIHEGEARITSAIIEEQLQDARELVSMEYIYTNADKYENQNQVTIFKWDVGVPFTAKSFLLSYDGRIKAGIEMDQVRIEVNESAHTVAVTLPPSKVTSHEIFEDNIRVFDEKDGIFNRITVENYADFLSGQKAAMEQRAIDLGLLTSADKNAQTAVKSLLSSLPGMERYTLTVTTKR